LESASPTQGLTAKLEKRETPVQLTFPFIVSEIRNK